VTDPARTTRPALRLARLAFVDGARAAELLSGPALQLWDGERNAPVDDGAAAVVSALGRTADPDAALAALAEIVAATGSEQLRAELMRNSSLRGRLLNLLGVSRELAAHLSGHPDHWQALLGDLDAGGMAHRLAAAVGADAADPVTGSGGTPAARTGADAVSALRTAYRRELVAIAGRDLNADLEIHEVVAHLSDLAGAAVSAALAVARAALSTGLAPFRLAVVAMGKAGARELNYISDVDVIFVAEPGTARPVGDEAADAGAADAATAASDAALAAATRLASETMRICRQVAWELDAGLRPEGKDGALVRTLASHENYYRRWASTWEFQALLKARPLAGDLDLGRRYQDVITPLVWAAAERPGFVADVRSMRRRVVEHIPAQDVAREVKLGPGGLRDIEFAVQLLQLVHGRADDSLRAAGTLPALAALRDGGYVGRDDAGTLIDAYRFLRAVEHRLQLRRLRRTSLLPAADGELLWLGRAMGYRPDGRGDARAVFEDEWTVHSREVRRLHEKLFYRPLLEAVARVPTDDLRLTPDQARHRLAALGFADPDAALRHIESLTAGLSRRATLQRTLLPVLLSDFADAPDPDRGLLAYRRVSDELGATPWYLRLLRDEGAVASRLAYVLGTSRYVARMLERAPEALQLLADDAALRPRERSEVELEASESSARQPDAMAAAAAVRGVRRQELLRIAFADLLGRLDVLAACRAISATTEATLAAALSAVQREVAAVAGLPELPFGFTIVAMGRLGGGETGYGSDADVMFVFDPRQQSDGEATRIAQQVAVRLRQVLGAPSPNDPPLGIDANLRPEGRDGPLVRSLDSYRQYYARWSAPWEAQALLRARVVAGDPELGQRFTALIDPVRYPAGGLSRADLVEIRRIKARIDTERLPRGADAGTHTKLGRGGLADIEWTVQLLQLAHGAAVPALRTTQTTEALDAAVTAGLVDAGQAAALADAWQLATRVRNALMLVRDRAEDQLATHGLVLQAVGRVLGYPSGFDSGQLVDDYLRTARRARRVVEEVFYDAKP
jgi:[glutamine synthetase] adenylyltransferase / [glutamine synthetase]-adenylyl-L-tyrosine phosphorylase